MSGVSRSVFKMAAGSYCGQTTRYMGHGWMPYRQQIGAHDLKLNLEPQNKHFFIFTQDLRNISDLLRWICVTFLVCECFLLFTLINIWTWFVLKTSRQEPLMGYITTIPYISSSILFILLNPNGDPQLSRQKKWPRGKRKTLTAKGITSLQK